MDHQQKWAAGCTVFAALWAPRFIIALVLVGGGRLGLCAAQEGEAKEPADAPRLEALVDQLGDHRFETRQSASREILEMGTTALPALQAARRSPLSEVRFRAERLIRAIEHQHRQERIELFEQSPDLRETFDLPLAKAFLEDVGYTEAARGLYLKMIRSQEALVVAFAKKPKIAAKSFWHRLRLFMATSTLYNVDHYGSSLAFLYLCTDPHIGERPGLDAAIQSLCTRHHYGIWLRLESGDDRNALRKLVGRWLLCAGPSTQTLRLAVDLELPEGLELAKQTIEAPLSWPVSGTAFYIIYKLGGQKEEAYLQNLLNCNRRIYVNAGRRDGKVKSETLVCDAALHVLLILHGENPKDYGMIAESALSASSRKFNTSNMGFRSKSARKNALNQWEEFRKTVRPVKTTNG